MAPHLQSRRSAAAAVAFALLMGSQGVPAGLDQALLAAVADPKLIAPFAGASAVDRQAIAAFYTARQGVPLFVDSARLTPRGRMLLRDLAAADSNGLDPSEYGATKLRRHATEHADLQQRAAAELAMAQGMLQYTRHLWSGRLDPKRIHPDNHLRPPTFDAPDLLRRAGAEGDLNAVLASYAPHTQRFVRLKIGLRQLRAEQRAGGWTPMEDGPTLAPGDSSSRVALLRSVLHQRGDLKVADSASDGKAELFDSALVAALRRFQRRHGLEPDGKLGSGTLAALNVPLDKRIEQVLVNIERERWLPPDQGPRAIFVNIAGYTVVVLDGDSTTFRTRAIVGKSYTMTPVFMDSLRTIVINPYWNVPRSIATKEYLPILKRDPARLARQGFEALPRMNERATPVDVRKVDWSTVTAANFSYLLRQKPGAGNALGRIKFLFPNHLNIYLHDTPTRSLFDERVRMYSHGCIRVQDPLGLAVKLLSAQRGWTADSVEAIIATGKETVVPVRPPLPIYLMYQTAWVSSRGVLNFRPDIYKRDNLVVEQYSRTHSPVE